MAPARDPAGRGGALFRRLPVWGEGFAEDDWSSLAAVSTWDAVDPDEYLRLFPRLVPRDGVVPEAVRAQLRLALLASQQPGRVRDKALDPPEAPAAREIALQLCAETGDAVMSPAGLHPAVPLSLAFLFAINPAYVWPTAGFATASATTVGWLGVLARGRAAYMPPEVAEVLLDQLADGAVCRDPLLARYVALATDARELWRVAAAVQRGRSPIARHRRSIGMLLRPRQPASMLRTAVGRLASPWTIRDHAKAYGAPQ